VVSEEDKKNAVIVLKAYSDAKKAGENKSFLDEMNAEFAKEFKLKVYTDKGSGKLFAADLEGNKIL
jgi:peroxiredoxin